MLKRKGAQEFVTAPFGVLIFVGVVIALITFVQASFVKFSAEMMVSERDMQAIDAAHIVETCFIKAGGSSDAQEAIKKEFLDSNNGKSPQSICGINEDVGARLECLECPGKPSYDFNYREADEGSTHRIFVPVSDGGKIYAARLTAKVYAGWNLI